ncbi:MAG: type II secretion system protein [Candidatus Aureabacteria bacterium]|nr:type II secretion system protein [Candidatus Auribacterota bacterium]
MKTKNQSGFTMAEMMISLGIFTIISAGIITGAMQISKNIEKTRNYVMARERLASFVQGAYSFVNRSPAAFFWDSDISAEMDYINKFPALPAASPMLDTIFFIRNDTSGNIARMVFDPAARTISWFSATGSPAQVMIRNVLRIDYVSDASPGTQSVFRFPHRADLYTPASYPPTNPNFNSPNFIVIQFRQLIAAPTSINPNPITIPVRLMLQLNTIT